MSLRSFGGQVGHDGRYPIRRQHRQRQHQDDAVPVRRAVRADKGDVVQQREGQGEGDALRQQIVDAEPVAAINLKQRPHYEDAKYHRNPGPGRQLCAERRPSQRGHAAGQRERKRHPAEEHCVDVAKASLALLDRAELVFPRLAARVVAAKDRIQLGGRDQTNRVGAQLDALAPALERIVSLGELARDRNERGRPEDHCHERHAPCVEQRLPTLPQPAPGGQQQDNG